MTAAIRMIRDFASAAGRSRDDGQGMVEYSLIVGTISIVLVAAFIVTGIGAAVGGLAGDITTAINSGTLNP